MNAKTVIRTANVTVACLAVLLPLVAQTGTAAASAGAQDGPVAVSAAQSSGEGWPWDVADPGVVAPDAADPDDGWPWD